MPGFKFGKYFHLGESGGAEEIDRQPHDYDEQLLRSFAERYFPDGCGPTMDLQTCMFTNTPDHHFVIDLHPDYPQVSIASPCSGHGFKFASVVGEIMADLAEKGFTRHDIDLFRLDRPRGESTGRQSDSDGRTEQRNGRCRSFPRAEDVRTFW